MNINRESPTLVSCWLAFAVGDLGVSFWSRSSSLPPLSSWIMLAGGIILPIWGSLFCLTVRRVCFLPELFISFPFLYSRRDPRTRGGEVIQTRCCRREEEVWISSTDWEKIRKMSWRAKEELSRIWSLQSVPFSFRVHCPSKGGSRVYCVVVRNAAKTSPSPRCAPCAAHCQYSDGRRAVNDRGREGWGRRRNMTQGLCPAKTQLEDNQGKAPIWSNWITAG